jgi:hypothetical protein
MSFDLQAMRDTAPTHLALVREHAIYLDAQRSDRKIQKARNVADLLERGHRPTKKTGTTGLIVDLKA